MSSEAAKNAKKADLDKANQSANWAEQLLGEFKSLSKALQLITDAISIRPKVAKWYTLRAQIYRSLGRNQLAFYDYNAALRLDARSYFNFIGRGLCLRKLRRYPEALADIETALEADPASNVFRFFRGTIYQHMEDYASAAEEYSAVLSTPGFGQRSRLLRASCYERMGRTSEALTDLLATTKGDTSNPAGFTALGIMLMELGRHSEAVTAFTGAVERAGQSSAGYSRACDNRAWALFMTGKVEEAAEDLASAAASTGDDKERSVDPSPPFHRGAVLLAQRAPLKALPELLRSAEYVEALVRKEARKAGETEEEEGTEGGGRPSGADSGSEGGTTPTAGRSIGGITRRSRRPVVTDGGPLGAHLLAPELAHVLGEGMPPALVPSGTGSVGGGAAASLVTLAGDDDTDSDTWSDAVRERDTSMQEPVRRRGGGAEVQPQTKPSGGVDRPNTAVGGGGGGDGGSDAGSVPSGSVAASGVSKGFRKEKSARNAGRSMSRGRAVAGTGREKPWATVPSWANERVWPESTAAFTFPRNRGTAMVAARVQCYIGLAYEMLGHAERALHHFKCALSAWPGCIPARFHTGLCLLSVGRAGEAEGHLTSVLTDTAVVDGEVGVVPPAADRGKSTARSVSAPVPIKAAGSSHGKRGGGGAHGLSARGGGQLTARAGDSTASGGLWSTTESHSVTYILGIASVQLLPDTGDMREGEEGGAEEGGVVGTAPAPVPVPLSKPIHTDHGDALSVGGASQGGGSVLSRSGIAGGGVMGAALAKAAREHEGLHSSAARKAKAQVLLARALARAALGKHEEAAEDFTGALRVPDALGRGGEALLCRARTNLSLRRVKAALADCEAAIAAGLYLPALFDVQGQAQAYMGRYQDAVASFGAAIKALQLAADKPPHVGRLPVSPRTDAAAGPPTPASAYLSRRGEAYRCLGNANAAVLDVSSAIAASPSPPPPSLLEQRAHAHSDNEDAEAALADYGAALAAAGLSPYTRARLHYCSGLVHASGDEWEGAARAFGAALAELAPVCGPAKFTHGTGQGGGSGEDADDERSEGKEDGPSGVMSSKLAASLATAAMRIAVPRTGPGSRMEGEEGGEEGPDAPIRPRFTGGPGLPLNTASIGQALKNLALGSGKGDSSAVVKSGLKGWAHKAKGGVTAGVSGVQLKAAFKESRLVGGADGKEGEGQGAGGARQRYIQRVAAANARGPEHAVRLRIAAHHERAKAFQHCGKHYEAVMDFTEVLASCPGNPHALLRRGVSYAALGAWPASGEDFETARLLRPGDARFNLNYAGLRGCEGIMLAGPGEEPQWPVLGLEEVSVGQDGGRDSDGPLPHDAALRAPPRPPLAMQAPNATGVLHPLATQSTSTRSARA